MPDQVIVEIPLDQLHESPFNPRRTFLDLEDLAANIKAEGRIHQPLKVRPRAADDGGGYEIIFGHRRYRAAPLAGLITVPCIVEPMNDAMARSAQIAENLQRKDVHPIEEAEGFQAMMRDDGLSADELAALVGKSRSHVYGRLKLLQACPQIRAACIAGEIGSEVALLIARLRTEKLQQKALGYIRGKYIDLQDGGAKSFRQIRALLNERFTLDLAGALFTPTDPGLVQEAGSCTGCMKRSGNAPEFQDLVAEGKEEDVDVDAMTDEQYQAHLQSIQHSYRDRHRGARFTGPDICTDPDCFAAKKKAHLAQEAARLRAEGKVVVDGGKAMAAVGADGKVKGAYVALKDVRSAWQKIKILRPVPVIIQNPRDGKLFEAVRVADMEEAGAMAPKPKADSGRGGYDNQAAHQERERHEQQRKAETEANRRLLRAVHDAAGGRHRSTDELRLVLRHLIEEIDNGEDGPELQALYGNTPLHQLVKLLPTMTADALGLLLLAVVIVRNVECWYGQTGAPSPLVQMAELLGIDVETVRFPPVQTPEPAADSASTPPTAARAQGKAAPAATKKKPSTRKVKDDAGDAGEAARNPRGADLPEEADA